MRLSVRSGFLDSQAPTPVNGKERVNWEEGRALDVV